MATIQRPISSVARFFFTNTRIAPLWLIVRLYLGYEWILSGWEKVSNSAWAGAHGGAALNGFLQGAFANAASAHPTVVSWYAAFLHAAIAPHLVVWSNIVAFGELAVGIALVVGIFTGTAAFFGAFMNINYLLAGAISTNPVMLVLALFLLRASAVSGYWGLDGLRFRRFKRSA